MNPNSRALYASALSALLKGEMAKAAINRDFALLRETVSAYNFHCFPYTSDHSPATYVLPNTLVLQSQYVSSTLKFESTRIYSNLEERILLHGSRHSMSEELSRCSHMERSMEYSNLVPWSFRRALVVIVSTVGLVACGGDGGGGSSANPGIPDPAWIQGSFASSSTYAVQCAAPRTGIDPATGRAYVDRQGSVTLENFWLRSWTHELYFWYREVLDRSPASYSTTASYFDTQKTTALTLSGKPKDQFHFTYATADWIALSQSGVDAGYGVEWAFITNVPPRILKVAFTEPGSPASNAGLTRGVRVLAIDSVSIDTNSSSGIDTLNAGLSPNVGETHRFLVQELNGVSRTVSMTAAAVTTTPVQSVRTIATASGAVGYMLFNSHLATSEQQLINAFTQLQQANVADLVLDLRYNGGGYLAIASEVAYMIAGASATNGRIFERTLFNDQYAPSLNPITGGSNAPMSFFNTAVGFLGGAGMALPTLNLPRVFVLTGSGTCSASEAIVNGLRGIGLTVIQIGNTTCGKPYGFYDEDNCGTTYFSVQFQGVNAAGFGDYADGFSPSYRSDGSGVQLPGCTVADDLNHALGDTAEQRLAAALFYRDNGFCSPSIGLATATPLQSKVATGGEPLFLPRKPWRENRILSMPSNR